LVRWKPHLQVADWDNVAAKTKTKTKTKKPGKYVELDVMPTVKIPNSVSIRRR